MKEDYKPAILIVDDSPTNLFAMERVLGSLDAVVLKAQSGNEALSLTLRHDFAVILLDVQMPDMDGFETATLMRSDEATKYVPVIFVTAISKTDKYVFKGYEAGPWITCSSPSIPTSSGTRSKCFWNSIGKKRP